MNSKGWLSAVALSLCLANSLLADFSAKSTVTSADGQVEIQTDLPSGKVTILRPAGSEMEAISRKAGEGDAAAQMNLSQVQYALKNPAEGERWLKQAALTRNISAEYSLGIELLLGMGGGTPRPSEGITWLKLAACEGHPFAQAQLAQCYRQGLGIGRDDSEAYVWFLISIRGWPGEDANRRATDCAKSLSSAQMERAGARARNFLPTVTERNPLVDAGMIRLKAISQSNGTPIVLVNDQAFTIGEQKKVAWAERTIEVRCIAIRTNSVIVATAPYWQRGELRLPN